jgi:hypothetical protein
MVLIAGIVLFVRPSALKGVETQANRWFDPARASPANAAIGRFVVRAPRLTGLLFLTAGVVCLRVLG